MRATAPASAAERRLRARLVEHCLVRRIAFKVANRGDGAWVGVVFALDSTDTRCVIALSRATLLRDLTALVDQAWPMKRGATHANRAAKRVRLAAEQRSARSVEISAEIARERGGR